MVAIADPNDFTPGDHLKVRRWWLDLIPYWHHGVYEGAGSVIDFGSGVWDGAARKTLGEFQDKSPSIDIEKHGRATFGTGYLFEADNPDQIVARGRFLVDVSPFPQSYNLIGLNCEHIANWCVVGSYCESHQTRFRLSHKGVRERRLPDLRLPKGTQRTADVAGRRCLRHPVDPRLAAGPLDVQPADQEVLRLGRAGVEAVPRRKRNCLTRLLARVGSRL